MGVSSNKLSVESFKLKSCLSGGDVVLLPRQSPGSQIRRLVLSWGKTLRLRSGQGLTTAGGTPALQVFFTTAGETQSLQNRKDRTHGIEQFSKSLQSSCRQQRV